MSLFHEDNFPSCYNTNENVNIGDVCLPISQSYNFVFNDQNDSDPNGNFNNSNSIIPITQSSNSEIFDLRRSNRIRSSPTYLNDYQTDLACVKTKTKYPIHSYISLSRLSSHFQQVILSIDSNTKPKSFDEVVKNYDWKAAMDMELIALEQNQTWTVVNLPPNCTTIGCKWVYKLKHKADGSIERCKARLVAKGFT